jgi:hypothetical protein
MPYFVRETIHSLLYYQVIMKTTILSSTVVMRLIVVLCMVCCSVTTWAQKSIVGGQVVDSATGEPLTGVGVVQKGTTHGVSTDLDGRLMDVLN